MALTIEVRFLGGLTSSQESVFTSAARRWMEIITEDLPPIRVGDETITGVRIDAQGQLIDGPGTAGEGNILGQASPSAIRLPSLLPVTGFMQFDSFDLASLEANGQLEDVIVHEMGHVLGIGSLWQRHGLVFQAGTNNPVFLGRSAAAEWSALIGEDRLIAAPIANMGGPGSAGAHWRESRLLNELMSPRINPGVNPISRLTIASLQDLGYTVSLDAGDAFALPSIPNLVTFADDAPVNARSVGCSCGSLQRPPIAPIELPDSS